MTQRQLMEKILKKFPDRKEAEIRDALNIVQKEFCRETRILEGEFTTFNTDGSSMYFTMGTDVVTIKQLDLNAIKIDRLGGVYEIEMQT